MFLDSHPIYDCVSALYGCRRGHIWRAYLESGPDEPHILEPLDWFVDGLCPLCGLPGMELNDEAS